MPINLEIVSEHWTADLHIANRILDLLPGSVQRVDTDGQFRELEKANFKNVAAILVRDNHPHAFRNFAERTARCVSGDGGLPSLWRISDHTSAIPGDPATLRLMTPYANRKLADFGAAFATAAKPESTLGAVLGALPTSPRFSCDFRAKYTGKIAPLPMLVLERLLHVFAVLRISRAKPPVSDMVIRPMDYRAVKAMVTNLPLTPVDRKLSADAPVTAESVFAATGNAAHQLALPDQSDDGNKWFTRDHVRQWTGLAYNTAKVRLEELENVGVLQSTLAQGDRKRGKQIHYRFNPNVQPPFQSQNPFDAIPDLAGDDYPR